MEKPEVAIGATLPVYLAFTNRWKCGNAFALAELLCLMYTPRTLILRDLPGRRSPLLEVAGLRIPRISRGETSPRL